MNRDVLRRQMFARGGVAYPMQNGGMAPAPLPADPGPMPAPAPMPPMDPGNADMGQVAQAAMQNGVDPAMLETMLTQYASGLDDLENAQDYETVMNGIRGDQQPIQQRYQELANVVGPEDAQQTPESVLTLVQPVMMMASVDQGIGSLAAEQMAAPVQGPMAEGIMSTVDMPTPEPEPMAAPAPMAGGPDPVNFNQGGEVQYFADGGVALPQSPLSKAYQDKLPLYQQILGVEDREKAFQDQKNMTQAQMLFDIAQGALMFATPGERNMSPAERLAQSFTPVLGNIGTRAGELQKFKQSQAEQDRALKLQALGSAEQTLAARRAVEAQKDRDATQIEAQQAAAAKREKFELQLEKSRQEGAIRTAGAKASAEGITTPYKITITGAGGEQKVFRQPLTRGGLEALYKEYGRGNVSVEPIPTPKAQDTKPVNFVVDGQIVSAVPGTPLYFQFTSSGRPQAESVPADAITDRQQYTLTTDISFKGKNYPAGSSPFLSKMEVQAIVNAEGNDAIKAYEAPIDDDDYFDKYGMTKKEFNSLSETDRKYLQGLPVLTTQDYFKKFGMSKNDFLALPNSSQQLLLGIAPEYEYKKITGDTGVDIVRINKRTGDTESIYSKSIAGDPEFFKITMPDPNNPESGALLSSIIDVSTKEGRAAVAKVNEMNQRNPGSATMQRIGTESSQISAFLVLDSTPGGGAAVRMSYDGGNTYIDEDGSPKRMPPSAFMLNDTIAYDVYRREKIRSDAKKWLNANDNALNNNEYFGPVEGGVANLDISPKERVLAKDVLQKIRNGTGQWSAIGAGINSFIGGFVSSKELSELFSRYEEGRQFTQLIYVLGRSALASNPRLAVADLAVTAKLFPNPDQFIANPETEAKKLIMLAGVLDEEERRLQGLRASDGLVSREQLAIADQKLGEIARLKALLGPIDKLANNADQSIQNRRAQEASNAIRGRWASKQGLK